MSVRAARLDWILNFTLYIALHIIAALSSEFGFRAYWPIPFLFFSLLIHWQMFRDVIRRRWPRLYPLGASVSRQTRHVLDNIETLVFERAIDLLITAITIALTSIVAVAVWLLMPDPTLRAATVVTSALVFYQCYSRLFPKIRLRDLMGGLAFLMFLSQILAYSFALISAGLSGVALMEFLLQHGFFSALLQSLAFLTAGYVAAQIVETLVQASMVEGRPEDPYQKLIRRVRYQDHQAFVKRLRECYTATEKRLRYADRFVGTTLILLIFIGECIGVFAVVQRSASVLALAVALMAGGFIGTVPFFVVAWRTRRHIYRRLESEGVIDRIDKRTWRFKQT